MTEDGGAPSELVVEAILELLLLKVLVSIVAESGKEDEIVRDIMKVLCSCISSYISVRRCDQKF